MKQINQNKFIYSHALQANLQCSGRKYAVFNFTFTVSSIKLFGFKNMAESAAKFCSTDLLWLNKFFFYHKSTTWS